MTKFKNIVLAAASLVIFSNITYAQLSKANYSVNAEEPISVKYLGDEGEYLLFQVTLKAENRASALFAIVDKNEGELYSSVFTGSFKVQTIKIEKRDEDQVLNFKLVLGKKTFLKSFSVNTSLVKTVTVAEHDITKL